MKVGKYISELLFTSEFVVLENFGEFSTKYIPARFVPEKKKVEAPSKVVAFNPKNKKDDKGALAAYMAKKEGVTAEKAKSFVETFVSEMNNSLKSGKKVELESIGQFSMAPNGEIDFSPDKSINYLGGSAGMKSVSEPEKKSPEQAKTEADKVLDKADEVKKSEETPKPAPKADAAAEKRPGQAIDEPKKPGVDEKKPGDDAKKPGDPSAKAAYDRPRTEPIKEKTGLPPALKWVAFLVTPILIVGVIFAFTHEYFIGDKAIDITSLFTKRDKPTQVTTVPDVERDAVREAREYLEKTEITDDDVAVSETVATPSTPEPGRRVYHIIVGSFEEEHNANIYADELQRKGAVNAKAFPKNPLGFYRVSYGFYYDLSEAERELTRVQQEENPDAWILHR